VLKVFEEIDCCLVTTYKVRDDETRKVGIVSFNESDAPFLSKHSSEPNTLFRIQDFLEKPSSTQTSSRSACPCFYFLKSLTIPLIFRFLREKKEEPLEHRDATGKFLAWLINEQRTDFVAWKINKRIDVGILQN